MDQAIDYLLIKLFLFVRFISDESPTVMVGIKSLEQSLLQKKICFSNICRVKPKPYLMIVGFYFLLAKKNYLKCLHLTPYAKYFITNLKYFFSHEFKLAYLQDHHQLVYSKLAAQSGTFVDAKQRDVLLNYEKMCGYVLIYYYEYDNNFGTTLTQCQL